MTSARPPKAPTGRPPPMILPNVVRSGRTPKRSCAPPHAIRNEMTSSKIRRIPWRSVSARSRWRNPSTGGITPPIPRSGSTMTAARCLASASMIASHARRHARAQARREPHLVFRRPREREPLRDRLLDRLDDLRRRVAQDQARVVAVEVEAVVVVGVPDVGALAALDVERVRVEERRRTAVAAGHDRHRLFVQGTGAGRLRRVLVELLLDTHAISSRSPVSRAASARYSSRWASSTVTARNRSDCPGLTCPTRPMSNEQTVATFV